jgi:hypothetical protein
VPSLFRREPADDDDVQNDENPREKGGELMKGVIRPSTGSRAWNRNDNDAGPDEEGEEEEEEQEDVVDNDKEELLENSAAAMLQQLDLKEGKAKDRGGTTTTPTFSSRNHSSPVANSKAGKQKYSAGDPEP